MRYYTDECAGRCETCKHLYYDVFTLEQPNASSECKKGLPLLGDFCQSYKEWHDPDLD